MPEIDGNSNILKLGTKKVVEGRPQIHEEKKTTHNISVTPAGWKGIREVARFAGCSSISELIEKIGRKEIVLSSSSFALGEEDPQQKKKEFLNMLEKLAEEVNRICQ